MKLDVVAPAACDSTLPGLSLSPNLVYFGREENKSWDRNQTWLECYTVRRREWGAPRIPPFERNPALTEAAIERALLTFFAVGRSSESTVTRKVLPVHKRSNF